MSSNTQQQSILKPPTCENNTNIPTSFRKTATTTNKTDKRLVLVVDDTRFMVERNLFLSQPETMLAKMFSSAMLNDRGWTKPNERGEYEIAVPISSLVFKAILEFYTEGEINCPPGVNVCELRSACEYFLIPFGPKTIKCQ